MPVARAIIRVNVQEVCAALAHDLGASRLIETIPCRGYRFLASIQRAVLGSEAKPDQLSWNVHFDLLRQSVHTPNGACRAKRCGPSTRCRSRPVAEAAGSISAAGPKPSSSPWPADFRRYLSIPPPIARPIWEVIANHRYPAGTGSAAALPSIPAHSRRIR